MTNSELLLKSAIENRDAGKLNNWEKDFVSQFERWSKKQLKSLTHNQYCKLRDISNK